MKKLLTLLFIASSINCFSQNGAGRIFQRSSKPSSPTFNSAFNKGNDYLRINTNDSTFQWRPDLSTPTTTDSTWVYAGLAPKARDGQDGKPATVELGDVTTLTGAPSSQANVIITDTDPSINNATLDFAFTIPKGDKGDAGSGSFAGIVSPEQYGACGCNRTLAQNGLTTQAQVDAVYPNIGATPSWQLDRASWQEAINEPNKIIIPQNKNYFFDGGIHYDVNKSFYIEGGGAYWNPTNNNVWTFLSRKTKPATKQDAEAMSIGLPMRINRLNIQCNSNQNGFDLNCLRYASITHTLVANAKEGYKIDFCLQCEVELNHCQSCKNGFMAGLVIPTNDPTSLELSSNGTRVIGNTCHSCIDTAFGMQYLYEGKFENNAAEGEGSCKIHLFVNHTNKTTSNVETYETFHSEQKLGVTIAVVKALLRHQKVEFRDFNIHSTGIVFDGQMLSTNGGNGGIIIHKLTGSPGLGGKYFRSRQMTWRFLFTDVISPTNHTGLWATDLNGVVPQMGERMQVGANSYLFQSLTW